MSHDAKMLKILSLLHLLFFIGGIALCLYEVNLKQPDLNTALTIAMAGGAFIVAGSGVRGANTPSLAKAYCFSAPLLSVVAVLTIVFNFIPDFGPQISYLTVSYALVCVILVILTTLRAHKVYKSSLH